VTDLTTTPALLRDARSLLISGGIVSIVIGIILLVWPTATVTVLAILLGIQLLALGILILVSSLAGETSAGEKVLGVLLGFLGILAGVAVFGRPLQTVAVVVVVIGAFWVVGGVVEFVSGLFGTTSGSRWLAMLSGALSIVAGIVALSWPEPTVAVLVWVIGIWSVIAGAIRLFLGLSIPKSATA
jgi:uncharacterized membrane protein HdeD (DUF308 family)